MTSSPLIADGETLRADVERTASFGSVNTEDGRGRTALPADGANGRARDYLVSRLEETGLDVRVDAVGNIAGRWTPHGVDPGTAPVAAGSHLDSVPRGGIFDGPLGVYAALEAVRGIRESDVTPVRPLEVVCFTGEDAELAQLALPHTSIETTHKSYSDIKAAETAQQVDDVLEW